VGVSVVHHIGHFARAVMEGSITSLLMK